MLNVESGETFWLAGLWSMLGTWSSLAMDNKLQLSHLLTPEGKARALHAASAFGRIDLICLWSNVPVWSVR